MFVDIKICTIFVQQFGNDSITTNFKTRIKMRFEGTKKTVVRTGNPTEGVDFSMKSELFSRKFKNNSDFILNSGNFYLTLQLELCPYVS